MQNRESKRSSICGVELISLAEATVTCIPGDPKITVSGAWDRLDYSTAEFSEQLSSDGTGYDCNLTISFSDSSPSKSSEVLSWCGIYVLAKLRYTDGSLRVVGTDQFPLVLSFSGEGAPHALRLTYKGTQPESARFL